MDEFEKMRWREIYAKMLVGLTAAKAQDESNLQKCRDGEIQAMKKLEEMKVQLIETNSMNWVVFVNIQNCKIRFQQLALEAHMSIQKLEEEIRDVEERLASL
jgi:hypothetical protein